MSNVKSTYENGEEAPENIDEKVDISINCLYQNQFLL
jgi:hypothetical protein